MTSPSIRLGQSLNNGTIDGNVEVFSIPGINEVNVESDDSVVVSRESRVSLNSAGFLTEGVETTKDGVFTALRGKLVVNITSNSPTNSRVEVDLVEFRADEGLTFFNIRGDG